MEENFSKLKNYLEEKKTLVDKKLELYFNNKKSKIWESMKYSTQAGGKRLRPILTLAVSELFGTPEEYVLPTACALEMIHTQSLIHDDLPSIDNDDLRRGKPTNHVVFGEAMAIIAGDALFALAFNVISENTPKNITADKVLKVISEISFSAGADGMCGGQAVDVTIEKDKNYELDDATLQFIHTRKTGAMIRASVRCGAILSGANENELNALTLYAENLGLAFQIVDDVLDVTGTPEELGKKTGKDSSLNKATYPRLYGISESMNIAQNHVNNAIKSIDIFGEKAFYLRLLSEYITKRQS